MYGDYMKTFNKYYNMLSDSDAIYESFDSNVSIEEISTGRYEFTVNGVTIVVELTLTMGDLSGGGITTLMFYDKLEGSSDWLDDDDDTKFEVTGRLGTSSIKVLSGVVQATIAYVKKYRPYLIVFSGDDDDSAARPRVYDMMTKRLSNRIPGAIVNTSKNGESFRITFTNNRPDGTYVYSDIDALSESAHAFVQNVTDINIPFTIVSCDDDTLGHICITYKLNDLPEKEIQYFTVVKYDNRVEVGGQPYRLMHVSSSDVKIPGIFRLNMTRV